MEGNTVMKELKYQINYGANLMGTIRNYPELLEGSREIFEAVGKRVRDELDAGGGRLIHGDFWSGK
jgi:hypothetical protein